MKRLLLPLLIWGLQGIPVRAEGGDVNRDGRTDQKDIELLDSYLAGTLLLQAEQIQAADADGDGKITASDRDLLQRRLNALKSGVEDKRQIDLSSADSGVVFDSASGLPLAGVEVSLPDEGITVRTDAEGRFRLPRLRPGKILTANADNYAPAATSSAGSGYRLRLERLSPRLAVIDNQLHHLGDDKYGSGSANNRDFRLKAEGRRYVRRFQVEGFPAGDLVLRIGSLIGLDTSLAVAAGQSGLTQFLNAAPDGLRIYLNNQPVEKIYLNGDNLAVTLPRALLRSGTNTLSLETYPLAILDDDKLGRMLEAVGVANYDDVEFAHLLIEDPNGGRGVRVYSQVLPTGADSR